MALALARQTEFEKCFVNSGGLSTLITYFNSPLLTADDARWSAGAAPYVTISDASLGDGYFSENMG